MDLVWQKRLKRRRKKYTSNVLESGSHLFSRRPLHAMCGTLLDYHTGTPLHTLIAASIPSEK